MALARRGVVVTGMGIISPFGAGVDRFWRGVVDAECAIRCSPRFSLSGGPTLSAPMPDALSAEVRREAGERCCEWALNRILAEATISAGLDDVRQLAQDGRGAVFFSNHFDADAHEDATARREWRADRWCGWLQERLNCDEGGGVLTGCTASNMAIGLGFEWIADGFCDWAVVGGMDLLHDELLVEFESLRMLSQTGCRPFGSDGDGTVLGDGAGLLLLESGERAARRRARPLARVVGHGVASDVSGLGKLDPEGKAIRAAMACALADAGLRPSDVDCINSGSTGTPSVDEAEARAIEATFGDPGPIVYSIKPLIGHSIGGAGVVEAIATILSLRFGIIPSDLADPRRGSPPASGRRLRAALNNTIAMSGHVCTTLFQPVPA